MKKNFKEEWKQQNKFESFKEDVKSKVKNSVEWAKDNKEFLIVVAPLALKATTSIVKVVGKNVNLRKEANLKNLYCYDRSLGHYWKLRRELSNQEWIEIDRRKNSGERRADILNDLGVLK